MGLLSSSVSITRYRVGGELKKPVLETIAAGLKKFAISEIDDDAVQQAVGWTSYQNPFSPDFSGSSFVLGTYIIFSLRIDKKSIPPKLVKKQYSVEANRRMNRSGRKIISSNEKKMIKEQILHAMCVKIPATPNVYDLVWNLEEKWLWFYTNLKTANEALESLFGASFHLSLIRIFPYTGAALASDLSDSQKDRLNRLEPAVFRAPGG